MTPAASRAKRSARRLARGFYDSALSEAERQVLPQALAIEGVDDEIALLRLRLRSVLTERPDDYALMLKGIELLAKTVGVRHRLSKKSQTDLAASLANVLRSVGELLPAGDLGLCTAEEAGSGE